MGGSSGWREWGVLSITAFLRQHDHDSAVNDQQGEPCRHQTGKGETGMIVRIWHGWTDFENADKYEALLKAEIFVGIQNRRIRGFKNIQLLRRKTGEEVEFVTVMFFVSLDAVREFAGGDYEAAVVPEKARALLSHFDARSQHYELREEMSSLA
jgi:heme-degrading monooxygenase HmoA